MKHKQLILLCSALVLAASFASKVSATAIPDLIITEVDNNTILLSGGDAGNWTVSGSADSWSLTRSSIIPGLQPGSTFGSWYEPDNRSEMNWIDIFYFFPDNFAPEPQPQLQISVFSDTEVSTDDSPVADGTVIQFSLFPNSSQIPYSIQFIDLGDTPAVPDTATTAWCLALGLLPLICFKHRRAVRQ